MNNDESFYNYLRVVQNIIANMSMLYLLDSDASKKSMEVYTETLVELFHDQYNFNIEFERLTGDQLSDIGFIYTDNRKQLMLIPIWFLPFIPENYPLYLTNGNPFDFKLEGDRVKIINNQWIDLAIKNPEKG